MQIAIYICNPTLLLYIHHILHAFCTLICEGGSVVHSYGRLIPHEFPITDLQQISGLDGIGRINCTVSSGTARFTRYGLDVGVSETMNGATAMLEIRTNVEGFQNGDLYCKKSAANYFYLFILSKSKYICTHFNTVMQMHGCLVVSNGSNTNVKLLALSLLPMMKVRD